LYFAYLFLLGGLTREERGRVVVILALFLAAAMFWAGFEQAGSSLNLFADRYTIREFGAFEIPAAWFQSLNPIFIIALAPLYSMLWVSLARRHLNPAAPLKFAAGLMILGAGFAVMIGAARLVAAGDQVLPTWLFLTYLLHTMGELALSPVGLSSVSKLAPRRFVGQMMGVWFLAASLGNIIAGLIAGEFRADAVEEMPGLYLQIVLTTVGSGLLLAVCAKPLKRLMGDRH
ncbi:MAG: MFS transporter, partial [Gammaproteobacteria bacterium]|nr:MFS transporter [Gammaproteobacteria bacterium]